MFSPRWPRRPLSLAFALALPVALAACPKKGKDPVAPIAGDADSGSVLAPGENPMAEMPPAKEVKKINFEGSIDNVDDILAGLKDVMTRTDPEGAVDPLAELQAGLLATGFAPGFLSNIDLSGTHAVSAAFPAGEEISGPQNAQLAASVAVIDGRKVIEATPASYRPQPLGDGVWEFREDQTRVLLRESGKELHLGFSTEDLDRASKLRAKLGKGRRIRARAWNIPVDDLDPVELLDLPRGSDIAKALGKVAKGLKAVEFESEFGTKGNFEVLLAAEAPFHKLGIEPLGKPRAASTALESRLPPDPVFSMSLSWGDPAMIHKTIKTVVPLEQIPQPFGNIVKQALGGVHGILDQVANDVVLAMYVDRKGRATVVIAADVKNEEKTVAGLRGVNEAVAKAVEAQQTMAGKNKDGAFAVDWKPEGLRFSSGHADKLAITVPKDFREDFEQATTFMKKSQIESIAFVKDKTAVVAIGAGARTLVGDVARGLKGKRKDSLAQSDGLGRVRKALGGCQVCVQTDPIGYFKFRLQLMKATSDDKKEVKEASAKLKTVGKLPALGETSAGIKVKKKNAKVGLVVPESTMQASAGTIKTLGEVRRFVDDGASLPAASGAVPLVSD